MKNRNKISMPKELAHLKASAGSSPLIAPSVNSLKAADAGVKALKEANAKAVTGFKKPQYSLNKLNHNRACVMSKKDEVFVFLPCSHQVVCASCNEDHGKKGKASCPCCNVKIEESMWV